VPAVAASAAAQEVGTDEDAADDATGDAAADDAADTASESGGAGDDELVESEIDDVAFDGVSSQR
jgi:hypothetical protein